VNARTVIADALQQAALADPDDTVSWQELVDSALVLRRAAGGADRVVLAWEPTPCGTCHGSGKRQGSCSTCEDRRIVFGSGRLKTITPCPDCCTPEGKAGPCMVCGGSALGGTVTLHTLAEVTARDVLAGEIVWFNPDGDAPPEHRAFRLVAVSPEPPKEPPIRNRDSPRWCATCNGYGDHHTDRHEAMLGVSPLGGA
jgi:hypothetical protein